MEKQTQIHRNPTFYIIGNPERKDEIKHIIEDEWGGSNIGEYEYTDFDSAYYINTFGIVNQVYLMDDWFDKSITNGWMKEYKLSGNQFKPFDRVVARSDVGRIWCAGFYSHYNMEHSTHILTNNFSYNCCLPYNKETAKLIGTSYEWEGGEE